MHKLKELENNLLNYMFEADFMDKNILVKQAEEPIILGYLSAYYYKIKLLHGQSEPIYRKNSYYDKNE